MERYTDDDLLNLRLKYKDNHEILELIDTVEELLIDNNNIRMGYAEHDALEDIDEPQ